LKAADNTFVAVPENLVKLVWGITLTPLFKTIEVAPNESDALTKHVTQFVAVCP
jgi:hypothetical protein